MKRLHTSLLACALAALLAGPAFAGGEGGKITPAGTYEPEFLSKNHRSRRYNNAPMPFAIFYDGHYAIHGTDQIKRLGSGQKARCRIQRQLHFLRQSLGGFWTIS